MVGRGFFELMAVTPESDARWIALAAGVLVLRLAATTEREGHVPVGAVLSVREEIRRVPILPLAVRLRQIVDAIEQPAECRNEWRQRVSTQLMAYGLYLHAEGLLDPALDVFGVTSEIAAGTDIYTQAVLRRAFALRLLKRFADAELAYTQLAQAARKERNRAMVLEARLGMGKLLIDRGNIPAAEPMIQSVIVAATAARQPRIAAKAHIDAACIAGMRHDPSAVIEHSYQALRGLERRSSDHDRTLVNIAVAFRELGNASASRQVARFVVTHAADADQRIASTLLLYDLAIDAGDFLEAGRYRRALIRADLTPEAAALYHEAVGREHAARGDFEEAAAAVRRMVSVAERHAMAELVIRGDAALTDIDHRRVPAVYHFRPPPLPTKAVELRLKPIEHALQLLCSA